MAENNPNDQSIVDFISGEQREIIVRALQALWRERKAAYNLACDLHQLKGKEITQEDFGINEVADELRKWGAAPQSY